MAHDRLPHVRAAQRTSRRLAGRSAGLRVHAINLMDGGAVDVHSRSVGDRVQVTIPALPHPVLLTFPAMAAGPENQQFHVVRVESNFTESTRR